MTEVMTYDRMFLGRRFRPLEFSVGAQALESYEAITGQPTSPTPVGLLAIYARGAYLTEGVMPSGGVMAGLEISTSAPMPLDTSLRAVATVSNRIERKGRGWVTIDIEFCAGSEEFAKVRVIGVWPL